MWRVSHLRASLRVNRAVKSNPRSTVRHPPLAIRVIRGLVFATSPLLLANTHASPVPADEISLLNGAEHFERLCTECHGWDPSEQHTELYSTFPGEEFEPIIVLPPIDTGRAPEPDVFDEEVVDDWPDWAGPAPVEEVSEEQALKADLLKELNAAIDAAYADDASPRERSDDFGDSLDDNVGDNYSGDYYAGDLSDELDERYLVLEEDAERRRGGATDLTDPRSYLYGTTEIELFNNIANGTGPTMPGFVVQLGSEDAVWDLVNYIRSLWGEEWTD